MFGEIKMFSSEISFAKKIIHMEIIVTRSTCVGI